MPTIRLLIKGRVQGVSYRAAAKDMAIRSGLTGWVKNTPEGQVEAIATGEEQPLQQFISWCREGPSMARVTDVIVEPIPPESFKDFSIRRD